MSYAPNDALSEWMTVARRYNRAMTDTASDDARRPGERDRKALLLRRATCRLGSETSALLVHQHTSVET
jgi:hypothetical protein